MRERPVGITILALLNLLGGAAVLVIQAVQWNKLAESLESIGVSSAIGFAAILFLGVLGVGAGIGMLIGKHWGWWAGAFYLFYSVARNLNILLMIPSVTERSDGPEGDDLQKLMSSTVVA
jgi:hypothetical protein